MQFLFKSSTSFNVIDMERGQCEDFKKSQPEDSLISLDQEVVPKILNNAVLIIGKIYFSLIGPFVIHFKNFIVNTYLK